MGFKRVAIVGAGPAGFYTAQVLLEAGVAVDLIEKLPTPHGLVRSGVAPDHPKIKAVTRVFEKTSDDPNFRFFGNVDVGQDVTLEQLRENFDAVVLATGASLGRKLGIPGEDLPNSLSAADVVPWYNGHPDYISVPIDLNVESVVVMGAGNVAMDVARILAIPAEELATTDIADHALDALHASTIKQVYLCARRGPEHVAFTPPELRELAKLQHVKVVVDVKAITDARDRVAAEGDIPKDIRQNLDALEAIANTEFDDNAPRTLTLKFFHTPQEIVGTTQVEGVRFTGEIEEVIPAQLFVSAIGYDGRLDNNEGEIEPGFYCVGWAKRGPTGVIGTNKGDGVEVAQKTLAYLDGRDAKEGKNLAELLGDTPTVDRDGWLRIDALEIEAGTSSGRPRVKFTNIDDLLKAARS
jgi:ferredoxin/flavodoxin---NADP+ reductase